MKQIMYCFLFFPIFLSAQFEYEFKLDDEGQVYFDKVVENESTSKNELYIRAKDWIGTKGWMKEGEKKEGFWMSNEKSDRGDISIEFEDKEEGKIFGVGRTNTLVYNNSGIKKNGGNFKYRLTMMFKEDKARILIENFQFVKGEMVGVNSGASFNEGYPDEFGNFGKKQIKKQWDSMRRQAIDELEGIISEFEKAVSKKSKVSDNW